MARRKKERISSSSQPPSSDAVPGTISAAAVRMVWSFPRWVRIIVLSFVVFVAAVFALWTSLTPEMKKDVLSWVGVESTNKDVPPQTGVRSPPGKPSPEVESRLSSYSHEIESLISLYNKRAEDIEQEMTQTAERWRQTGLTDRFHSMAQEAIAQLEEKRSKFRVLHQRHIEALKAGQLTHAKVYAQSINVLLGLHGSYLDPTAYYWLFYSESPYQAGESTAIPEELPLYFLDRVLFHIGQDEEQEELDVAQLTSILTDQSNPDLVRASAAELISRQCDASAPCMPALAAIFEFQGVYVRHWEKTSARLCEAGVGAQTAIPVLVKVLSHREVYRNQRSWISAMKAIACIGPTAAEAVPHIVAILTNPNPDPNDYYDAESIQKAAARSLGKLGKAAADALPALREAEKAAKPDVKNAAAVAIREIQQE